MRWAAALLFCGACGAPVCKSVPVSLPASEVALAWLDGGYAAVSVSVSGAWVPMVLDTGFDQTSIGGTSASISSPATLDFGGFTAGPMPLGFLTTPGGLVGNDVLFQLPLVHDARARQTVALPSFAVDAGTPIFFHPTTACRDPSHPALGPLGPFTFVVPAQIDGLSLSMALDTGAGATFVHSRRVAQLSARPAVGGVLVSTQFAGIVTATATRAKALSVDAAVSADSLLLFAPAVDAQLDRLGVDGYLGWTFLREFQVSLAGGRSATEDRVLGLTRFASQDHWTRDLVGIGIVGSPVANGLEVIAFLSVSPGRDAGLQVGDVITAVNGQPPGPSFGPAGTPVMLSVSRGTQTLQLSATVQDLLPDPP